ncbi:MAG: endo-1,4-beta-xylanase [Arenibacter algicola]|nr:endo-1,4-beta-xylanase [Arenibacter algicola]
MKKDNSQLIQSRGLKDVFFNDFLMGAAVNGQLIKGKDSLALKLVTCEYNSISPENVMKWMYIHPEPKSFNFEMADRYVDLGIRNKLYTIGHTLVWHSQIPDYLNKVNDSATMASYLENHIKTLVSRYRGKIAAWDVVNEALNEDGSLRQSVFLKFLGEDYIKLAFELEEKADPGDKLIYNDYNLWKPEKRRGVVKLVRQLQDDGIKIDAIGLQGHWSLYEPSLEAIEKSIITFSNLGLKVHFSELDISVLPNPWDLMGAEISQNFEESPYMNPYPNSMPDSVQIALANRYQDIFKLFLKHRDKIDRITFWGINDQGSWLNNWPIKGRVNYPLLFDRKFNPKMAYDSIVALKF